MNKMVKFLITVALVLPLAVQASQQHKPEPLSRAVPVAFNDGQWHVLLRIDPKSRANARYWQDFAKRGPIGKETANSALKNQTNSTYTIGNEFVENTTPKGEKVYFVPVKFIPGNDLYNTAQTAYSSNFVWIPTHEIGDKNSKGDISRDSHKQPTNVNRGVLTMLRNYLPDALAQLNKPQAPSSSSSTFSTTSGSTQTWIAKIKSWFAWLYYSLFAKSSTSYTSVSSATSSAAPGTARNSWLGLGDKAIYFYNRQDKYNNPDKYFAFTNFYEAPITLNGKVWPTSEHYYQAQKFPNNKTLQDKIQKANGARQAFQKAKDYDALKRTDWNSVSLQAMEEALHAKFTQHQNLKQLLLGTDNKILVESAGIKDKYYGAGEHGEGTNMLGQLLMYIRKKLKTNQFWDFKDFKSYKTPAEYFKNNP